MLYERLRKHKEEPHPISNDLININVKKLAEYLECDYANLTLILNGKQKPSKRLERDLTNAVNEIKKDKENLLANQN